MNLKEPHDYTQDTLRAQALIDLRYGRGEVPRPLVLHILGAAEQRVEELKKDNSYLVELVQDLQGLVRRKNQELDALGKVWCADGCPQGMLRFAGCQEVTEEQVQILEENARRARAYIDHRKTWSSLDERHEQNCKHDYKGIPGLQWIRDWVFGEKR